MIKIVDNIHTEITIGDILLLLPKSANLGPAFGEISEIRQQDFDDLTIQYLMVLKSLYSDNKYDFDRKFWVHLEYDEDNHEYIAKSTVKMVKGDILDRLMLSRLGTL